MLSFDEIGLIPASISSISSRKNVDPFTEDGKLPIFVAPMTCIINNNNFKTFNGSRVIPIRPVCTIPGGNKVMLTHDNAWQAMTLDDFQSIFVDNRHIIQEYINYHILIDCASGAMQRVFDLVHTAKQHHSNLTVMTGNIANPKTYLKCCEAGIDYVRVGVGGGLGCLTSVLTGFHASLPWLITECNRLYWNDNCPFKTKIVADGGINSIDKAIKALALGADYVMMGMTFAKCREACGRLQTGQKVYYGQSSVLGQIDRFGFVKGHIEGCVVNIEEEYTLKEYNEKFEEVLRSAMSYAASDTLNTFIGNVCYEEQSIHEFNCYNK